MSEFLFELRGLDFISDFFIKSSVILTFTFVLVFLFRKKSASLRHFLLSVSLICLLLIPFLSTLTRGWETGLLPTWQTGRLGLVVLCAQRDAVVALDCPLQEHGSKLMQNVLVRRLSVQVVQLPGILDQMIELTVGLPGIGD